MTLEQGITIPGMEQRAVAHSVISALRDRFFSDWRNYQGREATLPVELRPNTKITCETPGDFLLAHLVKPASFDARIEYRPRNLALSQGAYDPISGNNTDAMNVALKAELYEGTGMDVLRVAQKLNENERGLKVAEVINDENALLILNQIVQTEHISVDELHRNLVAPQGWISLARVWRAELIKEQVGSFLPTPDGEELVQLLLSLDPNSQPLIDDQESR